MYTIVMEELSSILSLVHRPQTSYTIFFFNPEECQYALFNKPLTGHTARVAMDAVRAHLGTQFISSGL